jgi:predicted nucleotidyltransferase
LINTYSDVSKISVRPLALCLDIIPISGIIILIMGMKHNLSAYLFNKTRRRLLALLYRRPDESFYVNQIIRLLDSGQGAVQRELRAMTDAGIVVSERKGNLVLYRADDKCTIFNELKSIVGKTSGTETVIRDSSEIIKQRFNIPENRLAEYCRRHHINRLALFGSVLGESFRPESDIDVLVEFEPGHIPGFGIIDMENELSQMVGRRVDLRTPKDLSRYFRDRVVCEARVQYAAAGK